MRNKENREAHEVVKNIRTILESRNLGIISYRIIDGLLGFKNGTSRCIVNRKYKVSIYLDAYLKYEKTLNQKSKSKSNDQK